MTGDDTDRVRASGAGAPVGRGEAAPGSLPYLTLAEIGYFGEVALIVVDFVLLAATMSTDYSSSVPSTVVGTLLGLMISVAWFQLGRKVGNSWFLAAGISGAVGAVLGLAPSLGSGTNPSGSYIVLLDIAALVSLVYFVMQVSAFFSAARTFQVRLFRYAGYLFVIAFVVTFVVAAVGTIASGPGTNQIQSGVNLATYGLDYVLSAMTSMVAGIGFHRLRGTAGVSGLNLSTGGQPSR